MRIIVGHAVQEWSGEMRLIDKDSLIDYIKKFYNTSDEQVQAILDEIEAEPELLVAKNLKTRDIEVYRMDDVYDQEETIPNCTVQILTNTKTGATSVGWWRNE